MAVALVALSMSRRMGELQGSYRVVSSVGDVLILVLLVCLSFSLSGLVRFLLWPSGLEFLGGSLGT